MKTLTYEKALLMFVQLKENPTPTIVHTDAEWEDILETIDWLFGDRIIPLKKCAALFLYEYEFFVILSILDLIVNLWQMY